MIRKNLVEHVLHANRLQAATVLGRVNFRKPWTTSSRRRISLSITGDVLQRVRLPHAVRGVLRRD